MPNTGNWLVDYPDGAPAQTGDVGTFQRGGTDQVTLTVDDVLAPEAAARLAGDNSLADDITAEAAARAAADTTLGGLITAEATARADGDDALADAIADLAAVYHQRPGS